MTTGEAGIDLNKPLKLIRIEGCGIIEAGGGCACTGACTRYAEISYDRLQAERCDAAEKALTHALTEIGGMTHPVLVRRWLRDRIAEFKEGRVWA
jgi:hypothetical protein